MEIGTYWSAMKNGDLLFGPYHSSFDNLHPRRILFICFDADESLGKVMLEDGTIELWEIKILQNYWKVVSEKR